MNTSRMSFAISLTVFAFSTMDISDCLRNGTDANTCLVWDQTVYGVVHLVEEHSLLTSNYKFRHSINFLY